MMFKSFDVGEKAVRCHKSEVLSAFLARIFVMASQILQSRQLSRPAFCLFKLQRIVTGRYFFIFTVRCWKFRGGRP